MALPSQNPTKTQAWKALQNHFNSTENVHLKSFFATDPNRAKKLTVKWEDFYVDFSKNRIDETTIKLLEVDAVKQKIKGFCDKVISGAHKGYTGKAITDIVNIGIGGSDLGPVMITEALEYYKNHLKVHFISNVDGDHIHQNLKNFNPETTLFVVVSKTFSTQETLSNATTARSWFIEKAEASQVSKHFVAVSSNVKNVTEFGIAEENIFPLWDWVGGRFSLWSAVGLSVALSIGFEQFDELLQGANQMDTHFKNEDFEKNIIIWGEAGTNSQHAFFQLIHQGTKIIPTEFIGFKSSLFGDQDHHDKLMANFFAQTEALMNGKTENEVIAELKTKKLSESEIAKLAPFKVFKGNRPTTTLLIDKLTPKSLGALVAMYEHRIFVQGVIWNIYSYDQWGVELGKQLATNILNEIHSKKPTEHDSSTNELLKAYLN